MTPAYIERPMLKYKNHLFRVAVCVNDSVVVHADSCACRGNKGRKISFEFSEAEDLWANGYAGLTLEEFLVSIGMGVIVHMRWTE